MKIAGRLALCAMLGLAGCKGPTVSTKSDPNIVMTRSDEEIQLAAKKARKELPAFLARLEHPKQGDQFAVNVKFQERGSFEHIWVDDLRYDGKTLTGKLADQPVLIKDMQKGQTVTVATRDIYDWLIRSDGKIEGGYVQQVLLKERGG